MCHCHCHCPAPCFASSLFLPSLLCQILIPFLLSPFLFRSVPPFLVFHHASLLRPSLSGYIFSSWFPSFHFRLLRCSPPLCQFFFFLSFLPSLTLFAFFCLSRACSPQTSNDLSPERHQALTLLSGLRISNRIHSDMTHAKSMNSKPREMGLHVVPSFSPPFTPLAHIRAHSPNRHESKQEPAVGNPTHLCS